MEMENKILQDELLRVNNKLAQKKTKLEECRSEAEQQRTKLKQKYQKKLEMASGDQTSQPTLKRSEQFISIVEHETELQARLLEHEERHRSQMQNLEQLLELTKQSLQSQQRSLNHTTSYQTDYLYHQSQQECQSLKLSLSHSEHARQQLAQKLLKVQLTAKLIKKEFTQLQRQVKEHQSKAVAVLKFNC